ncbi:MAG: HAMP domain-containing sensor histidine kinase [Candidatus Roizmanbacteria bacterium]
MFHSARLKLTLWYLSILMIVSILFSVAIYRMVVTEVVRFEAFQRSRAEARMGQLFMPFQGGAFVPRLPVNDELIEETKGRILMVIVILNASILLTGGGIAYLLAGKTLDPIQRMMESQKRFIGDASHELKTPLTSLRIASEVFMRDPSSSLHDARILIADNLTEIDGLQSLLETLIQMNKLEYDNKEIIINEHVSIKKIVSQSIQTISAHAASKSITITHDMADRSVIGNELMLVKLLTILLDNAIKYSTVSSEIAITTSDHASHLILSVIDQGMGIDHKDLPHIFTRFYRADTARTRTGESGGYGLGLSIAQKIADMHGTKLTVKSEKGSGSTFSISLKLTPSLGSDIVA